MSPKLSHLIHPRNTLPSPIASTIVAVVYFIIISFIGPLFRFLEFCSDIVCRYLYDSSIVNICSPHFESDAIYYALDFTEVFDTPPIDQVIQFDPPTKSKHSKHDDNDDHYEDAPQSMHVYMNQVTKVDIACSFLSQLAYENRHRRKQLFKTWVETKKLPPYSDDDFDLEFNYPSVHNNFKSFLSTGRYDTHAYVLPVSASALVIAFRGSEPFELSDWFTDASIVQHPLHYSRDRSVMVHRGFVAALGLDIKEGENKPPPNNIVYQIIDSVSKLIEKHPAINSIYITGHSLGGALAQQFSYAVKSPSPSIKLWHPNIQHVGSIVKGVYTYGTPRSGNQAFVDDFNDLYQNILVHRIVYNNDVMARVPFSGVRLQWNGQVYNFQYSSTKGLIYLIAPISKDAHYYQKEGAIPWEGKKDDHHSTVLVKPRSEIKLSANISIDEPIDPIFVAPPSVIPDRPDHHLGFAIGWTSLSDHCPHLYTQQLYRVWSAMDGHAAGIPNERIIKK